MPKTLFLVLLVSLPLAAQTPYLVKDINTTYATDIKSSSPVEFVAFGGKTFFVATTDSAGTELWSTDGTSGGTSMVADIIPGTGSSNPSGLKVVNGALVFSARDVNHGIELWTSDGTAAGTHILLDINPGPSSSQPILRILYKNQLLFTADDGTNGRELWTTDGTSAGTHVLKNIFADSPSTSPNYFAALNDLIYFLAPGGLWKTDGTDAGTVKVSSVTGRNLAVAGSQLFFEGFTTAGIEPWVSDGTDAGTHMITDILPGTKGSLDTTYSFFGFTPLGNKVLFPANDGVHGRELWISDGTAAGTRMLRDLTPGAKGTWDAGYAYITTFGNRAFFSGFDADHGYELWVTDGTDAGTALFADLSPGPDSSFPVSLVASGTQLFFEAGANFNLGPRLWVTDGTAAGTHVIVGNSPGAGFGVSSPSPINGKLYFNGRTTLNGSEPWVSDGTDAGTRMIANLQPDGAPSSQPYMLTAAGNLLFFNATEGTLSPISNIAEDSLWRTDGTAAGTFKLLETGQFPGQLMSAGPLVFFPVQGNNSASLWTSDGTVSGTKPADDFLRRFGKSSVDGFFTFGDTIFASVLDFSAYNSSLWRTSTAPDGSAAPLGAHNSGALTEVAGNYFFFALEPGSFLNYGLWRTDGTADGTYTVVPEIHNSNGTVSKLANASGTLFFVKGLQNEPIKLWKSDGTFDGTVVVKELPLSGNTFSAEIKAAGRRVFFTVGGSLWTSDGTESGTIELATVKFFQTFDEDDIKVIGNRIVFAQYDSTKGFDLWTSDGTVQGTKFVASLGQTHPNLTVIDGTVYFTGTDDQHGTEMWTTDGTAAGTKLFLDMNPGPASSNAGSFTKAGQLLYFTAYTDAIGAELWALPLIDPGLSISDARAPEGDTGTTVMRFNVTLSPAAKQPVTVDYTTSDGTAHAGDDYDAASGTLTFAPGETTRTIDVRVRGDVVTENNETVFVTLKNAVGARVIKGEAAGIIDDDDQAVDLSVAPQLLPGSPINDAVSVSNAGPRAATDITVKITATPSYGGQRCLTCLIGQLPTGTSASTVADNWFPSQQVYLSATATARQKDLQPANNSAMWTLNGSRTMAMNAGYLITGTTATISAALFSSTPVITSSDPSVVSMTSTLTKVGNSFGTFTVSALKPGVSTITVDARPDPLQVTVVAPGTMQRWPGGMTMSNFNSSLRFDQPLNVIVTPNGTAPISGNTATGTVIVSAAGKELARRTINGTATVTLPVYLTSLGPIPYTVSYSGDATFLPQSVTGTAFVTIGSATLSAGIERVAGTAGSFTLTVHATGSPVAAPTGTLSVRNGGTEIATVTLVPSSDGTSFARATLTNLPASPTLTINYPGDALYGSGSQQVRLVETRRRAAGHE